MKSKECVMCHGLAFYCPYCGIDKRAPSPKPCAGCANKAVEEYLKDSSYLVPKLNIPHTCHQPKPEVSPEKKEKCEDSQCFDANCSTHGIHPTPPEKKERCVPCAEGWDFHTHTPPAKEEKEVCFDANCKEHGVKLPTPPAKEEKECNPDKNGVCTHPTPTDQKGEWEEFSDYFERVFASCDTDCADKSFHAKQLFTFIAAKKKEWEAQKEQSVKAEIKKDLNLNEQKPEDFGYANGNDLPSFCRGYNACKDYVEWVLAGRSEIKKEKPSQKEKIREEIIGEIEKFDRDMDVCMLKSVQFCCPFHEAIKTVIKYLSLEKIS